MDEEKTMTFLY